MKILRVLAVLLLISLAPTVKATAPTAAAMPVASVAAPPAFDDFPATTSKRPRATDGAVKLHLTTAFTKRFTTVLHEEFQQPANFAGHYRVAIWGCGTDCRSFAILDKTTGTAYTLEHVELIAGVMGNDDERIDFRRDSRLLVIAGEFDDDDARRGKFYYLWTGQRLEQIYSSALAVEKIDTH
ncbi:hypothetical protein [Paraburkholderia bannensis]|uniref:hypothetical protein n=1 Tax=Paraburkholderia bannensis TaxID=765414 RepID=UPI002ABDD27F|nr:hypothetical protein [Paraburkholderia bannensis]